MKSLLKELLFLVIGVPLFLLVFVLGFVYTFLKHLFRLDYSISRQLLPILRSITLVTDGLANAGCGELLNDTYKPIVNYGKWHQTISAVTGINYLKKKDTKLRIFLDKVLGKKHCEDAITDECKYFYIDKK